jgi:ElaB/YqjD/DUF883 family membrane-anchored ribosome-binding protein
MNKYLIEILKNHSSLILPGIGALMVTNRKTGDIKFNPHLTFNDGALASYIATEENIDKTEAQNMVAKFTSEIKAVVDKGETYDIFEFGTIFKDSNGEIAFEMAQSVGQAKLDKGKDNDSKNVSSVAKKDIANDISNMAKTETDKATESLKGVKEKTQEVVDKAESTIKKATEKAAKKTEESLDKASSKASETAEKVIEKSKEKIDKAVDAVKTVKNTYIPPVDKEKLPEVPKIIAADSSNSVKKEAEKTKKTVEATAEYVEKNRRKLWPIILLLFIIGLAIVAYFFRDDIKAFLGWNDTVKIVNINNYPDADNDGIPDFADVDLTGGADEDGDGIDDLADVDFTHGTDADGDQIDDDFAASAMLSNDIPEPTDPFALADEDGDGIPDYADSDMTNGEDTNGNGIDDNFDAAVLLGTDEDGDGIVDSLQNIAKLDHLKNQMPDSDANGIPDYADVALTEGQDVNKNGIDDSFESIDLDKNGDGLNDSILLAIATLSNIENEEADNVNINETAVDETEVEPEVEKTEVEPVTEQPVVAPTPESTPTAKTSYKASGNYHAIGAAFSDKANADQYTSDMSGKGFSATIIGRFDGLYLVSLKQYGNLDEAKADLTNMRKSSSSAWIFKH